MAHRFYIDSSIGILELTSTTEINVNETSNVTKHPLEDGSEISDHIVNNNRSISFSGLISDVRRLSGGDENVTSDGTPANASKDVREYYDLLQKLRDSKERFSVIWDIRFPTATDCLITSVNLVRNKDTGTGYNISLAFEQVRVVKRATEEVRRADLRDPDESQGLSNSSNTETERRVTASSEAHIAAGLQGKEVPRFLSNEDPRGSTFIPFQPSEGTTPAQPRGRTTDG